MEKRQKHVFYGKIKGLTDEVKGLPRFVFEYDRALTYYQKSLALKLMKMAPEEGLAVHFLVI